MDQVSIVIKLFDIFPNDLFGLPSDKEIEFYIDLVSASNLYIWHCIEWHNKIKGVEGSIARFNWQEFYSS